VAKAPLKGTVFLVAKTSKLALVMPAKLAYRGTRGALRKVRGREMPAMIFNSRAEVRLAPGALPRPAVAPVVGCHETACGWTDQEGTRGAGPARGPAAAVDQPYPGLANKVVRDGDARAAVLL
jgi:hypothetical protein